MTRFSKSPLKKFFLKKKVKRLQDWSGMASQSKIREPLFEMWSMYMRQLQMFEKVEYGGGPIFNVVLEC